MTMIYRDPSDNKKRKKLLKPSYKSTWTVEKLLKELINECIANINANGNWTFIAEKLSEKYRAKIEIVSAAIQKLHLHIPQGYHILEHNDSPHESLRHRFLSAYMPGGWRATQFFVTKQLKDQ